MDMVLNQLDENSADFDENSDATALYLIELKDNQINPLTDEQFSLLRVMEDEVCNDRLDVDKLSVKMELVSEKFEKVAASLKD